MLPVRIFAVPGNHQNLADVHLWSHIAGDTPEP
jgi:hypothetical protein